MFAWREHNAVDHALGRQADMMSSRAWMVRALIDARVPSNEIKAIRQQGQTLMQGSSTFWRWSSAHVFDEADRMCFKFREPKSLDRSALSRNGTCPTRIRRYTVRAKQTIANEF